MASIIRCQAQSDVKDTIREFREKLERDEGAEGEEDHDDDVDALVDGLGELDLLDEGLFGQDKALEGWERANVEACLRHFDVCGRLLKAAAAAVDEAGGQAGAQAMDGLAGVVEQVKGLSVALIDAADGLYPPQDPQEIEAATGRLRGLAGELAEGVAALPMAAAESVEAARAAAKELGAAVCSLARQGEGGHDGSRGGAPQGL
jgi:hypothetical protein